MRPSAPTSFPAGRVEYGIGICSMRYRQAAQRKRSCYRSGALAAATAEAVSGPVYDETGLMARFHNFGGVIYLKSRFFTDALVGRISLTDRGHSVVSERVDP